MRRILSIVAVLLLTLGWQDAFAIFPRGGVAVSGANDAFATLINGMAHNSWKKLDAGALASLSGAQYYDAGYGATTGTWSSSSSTIVVSDASKAVIGDLVTATGIPANDYITNVVGTTITLSSNTTGSGSGAAVVFSTGACSSGGNVVVYSSPAIRTDVGKIKLAIQGGGHSDGCDSGVYTFDAVACADSINHSMTTNCFWTNAVPSTRYLPVYYNGSATPPSWSCQAVQDNIVGTATFSAGSGTVVINIVRASFGINAPYDPITFVSPGGYVWGPGIPAGATFSSGTFNGTNTQLTLTLAGGAVTTAPETNAVVMASDGTSSQTIISPLMTTTAGSTAATLNADVSGTFTIGAPNVSVSGPTIPVGTTVASHSGTSVTLSQAAIASQTLGPVWLSLVRGTAQTNINGTNTQQATHTYYADFSVPGTTKWVMGGGGFGWGETPQGGGGVGWLFDDSNNSFSQIGGIAANNCFYSYEITGSMNGALQSQAINDLDGAPWSAYQQELGTWATAYTTSVPTFSVVATAGGTALTNASQQLPQLIIKDPVNGSSVRALFVDISTNGSNQFGLWTGLGNAACSPCVEHAGTFSTAPSAVYATTAARRDASWRGSCTDGTYIYEWEGTGIIYKITPQAGMTGWSLAALNASPTGDVPANLNLMSEQTAKLGCLGSAYSSAILAFTGVEAGGTQGVWVYRP